MHTRRSLLAALLGLLALAPLSAHADVAPSPPVLAVEGHHTSITAAAPDRAQFVLRNLSDEPLEVFLHRVIVLDGGTRVPLEITRVEIDGAEASRTLQVPAGGERRVVAHFELPRHMRGRAEYSLELALQSSGPFTTNPAVLTRARGAHKWAREPAKAQPSSAISASP